MIYRKFASGAIIFLFIILVFYTFWVFKSKPNENFSAIQTNIYTGKFTLEDINNLKATQWMGENSEEQAIGLAQLYCMATHSAPKQALSNIEAFHLTETEANIRLHFDRAIISSNPVWLVSMDGMWEHEGPQSSSNETNIPIIFTHCNVIINAETGDMMTLTN